MFLYVDNSSLTMELFAEPAYFGFADVPKDDFFITLKMWESIAGASMTTLTFDFKYQIPGAVSDGEMANYQVWMSKERPELE